MYHLSCAPLISLGNQTRCADLLIIITKASTTKWPYFDSITLIYSITETTTGEGEGGGGGAAGGGGGSILPHMATNLVLIRGLRTSYTKRLSSEQI